MTELPQYVVAISFTVAGLFGLYDMGVSKKSASKMFRLFEAAICFIAAFYYWVATLEATLPSPNLRYVWVSLCIILCSEVISRQDWGSRK